ncbi:hypothetical protein BGZ80_002006 [Entomortierella chlamydospora]|uniref:Uncharacterized protein n=1 Tax=Entomortierella chlamydospora TaxID=101097 RepID=A0A9P6MQD3_9FUNG|nr:hypothetical protein BGZ80_002006 [Entomortierella chlamydospora]
MSSDNNNSSSNSNNFDNDTDNNSKMQSAFGDYLPAAFIAHTADTLNMIHLMRVANGEEKKRKQAEEAVRDFEEEKAELAALLTTMKATSERLKDPCGLSRIKFFKQRAKELNFDVVEFANKGA